MESLFLIKKASLIYFGNEIKESASERRAAGPLIISRCANKSTRGGHCARASLNGNCALSLALIRGRREYCLWLERRLSTAAKSDLMYINIRWASRFAASLESVNLGWWRRSTPKLYTSVLTTEASREFCFVYAYIIYIGSFAPAGRTRDNMNFGHFPSVCCVAGGQELRCARTTKVLAFASAEYF